MERSRSGTKAKKKAAPAARKPDIPIAAFEDKRRWATWLAANHATSPGLWLKLAKKDAGIASVSYAEAVEVALIWGWIDGQKQSHDATAWLQKFTRRGARSVWSKINRDKALALIEAGQMKPPGLAEVERAQADGRWERAYDSPSAATVPADLEAALKKDRRAATFFADLDKTNRYAILWRIQTAKKPETRAARIAKLVEMLARGEKLH